MLQIRKSTTHLPATYTWKPRIRFPVARKECLGRGANRQIQRVDTRTGVNDKDYTVPFAFTGKIDKLTFKVGPPQLTAEDNKKAAEAIAIAKD